MVFDGSIIRAQVGEAEAELATARNDLAALGDRYADAEGDIKARDDLIVILETRIAELEAQVPKPTQPPTPTPTPSALKPGLKGLVTTNPGSVARDLPYSKYASWKPHWGDLNPSRGVFNFAPIHTMLRTYPNLLFRPRVMAGTHAPDWVKARSGGAIHHDPNTQTGAQGEVPRFWTENYFVDYMDFMRAFAAEFEKHPQVVEVPVSITTTIYAEPFILNCDAATATRYWNAGYRFEAARNNLLRSIHGMMELFPTTRISLAGHGKWEYLLDGTGKITYDWPSKRQVFNELIDQYGAHLVLDDHGLGADDAIGVPQPRESATGWYNLMAGLKGSPLTYGWQLTPKDLSKLTAVRMAITMGARFCEFAGFNDIPEPTRQECHNQLLANAAGKP